MVRHMCVIDSVHGSSSSSHHHHGCVLEYWIFRCSAGLVLVLSLYNRHTVCIVVIIPSCLSLSFYADNIWVKSMLKGLFSVAGFGDQSCHMDVNVPRPLTSFPPHINPLPSRQLTIPHNLSKLRAVAHRKDIHRIQWLKSPLRFDQIFRPSLRHYHLFLIV